MKEFKYIPIQLVVPEGNVPKKVRENCEYIKYGFYIRRNTIVCALSENITRNQELDIWKDIKPTESRYLFEFIIELPFFLPNFKKHFEYDLGLNGRTYIINNRHCEIIDDKKENFFLAHANALKSLDAKGYKINQFIKLKTLISTQFYLEAETASIAIEKNFYKCLEICQKDISKIISTLRYCSSRSPELIPDCANIQDVCPIYVLCVGANNKGILRFVKHLNASPLQALSCIENISKPAIERFLNDQQSLDEGKELILKSKQLFGSGEYVSACIIACTACEVIMNNQLNRNLSTKGLGKKKIDEATDNLTFSQLIKLTSNFVYKNSYEFRSYLNKIDKIRKIRNKIVHEGKIILPEEQNAIKDVLESFDIILKK